MSHTSNKNLTLNNKIISRGSGLFMTLRYFLYKYPTKEDSVIGD